MCIYWYLHTYICKGAYIYVYRFRRSTVGAAVDKGHNDYGKKEFWEKRYNQNKEHDNEIEKIPDSENREEMSIYEWYLSYDEIKDLLLPEIKQVEIGYVCICVCVYRCTFGYIYSRFVNIQKCMNMNTCIIICINYIHTYIPFQKT
jgi:hypothetical protein